MNDWCRGIDIKRRIQEYREAEWQYEIERLRQRTEWLKEIFRNILLLIEEEIVEGNML